MVEPEKAKEMNEKIAGTISCIQNGMMNKPNEPCIIDLPRFLDHRGNLSVVEQSKEIPFTIKRAYWIYDVPGGEAREGHAYHENYEFIIALSGSFDVVVDNGLKQTTYSLNRSYYGLLLPQDIGALSQTSPPIRLPLFWRPTPYNPR